MNIRKLFTRIFGDNDDTRHFMRSNPDCPQSLREAARIILEADRTSSPTSISGTSLTTATWKSCQSLCKPPCGAETPPKSPHRHPL